MKVSARNVFEGRVSAINSGAIHAEVTLTLNGGEKIVAVVTQAGVRELGLEQGSPAYAIVKAPWVIVAADEGGPRFSARNQLRGTVREVKSGAVNSDVTIELNGGLTVHAVITNDAVADLGLAPGVAARAIIKASHVVLAA